MINIANTFLLFYINLQELIGSAKRRKQCMLIAGLLLIAIAVILAIVLSVMLVKKSPSEENLVNLELDDILRGKLQPKRFNGTWIDDKSFYYFDVTVRFLHQFTDNLINNAN